MPARIKSYREFWPYYLREHAKAETRTLHFIGTAVASTALLAMFVSGQVWLAAVALAGFYGPAWFAHLFLEHNHPAIFSHPLWSLISDYRMTFAWVTGRLDSELKKAENAWRPSAR